MHLDQDLRWRVHALPREVESEDAVTDGREAALRVE
jgi:hypothetical protein